MPLFFLLIGILLIFAAINNKLGQLGSLVAEDFAPTTGAAGFQVWIVAIFIIGALGYVKELKPLSNAFLVLILVVLILSNRGFFANFKSAVEGR